jgi:hypothetical protein
VFRFLALFTLCSFFVLLSLLSFNALLCEGDISDPNGDIFEFHYVFSNLLENKGLILSTFKGVSAIYMFKCLLTGDSYVGSAVDLARRFSEHMKGKNSTPHLQNAIKKYGITSFAFIILTIVEPSMLVAWEQLAIDLMRPRYNILQTAGSLQGFKWSSDNIAKISGPNNHAFGKLSHKRIPIFCFDSQTKQMIFSFTGVRAASKSLGICNKIIKKYVNTGIAYNGLYFSTKSTGEEN